MAEQSEFSSELLKHISCNRYEEAKPMLSKDVVKASDQFGTLLHYAAFYGRSRMARYLIELGSDVNALDNAGETALMLAVECGNVKAIKVLLEAGADVNVVNATGKSVLRIVFHQNYCRCHIIGALIDRLRGETDTTEQIVEKLIELGASLYHAACSRDIGVMKSMLDRGFDVNSRHPIGSTALHVSVVLNDLNMAMWLVENGADVNACDNRRKSPLFLAALNGKYAMLNFLLEHGADLNGRTDLRHTPLLVSFICSRNSTTEDQYVACAECLLQNGATPHNPSIYKLTLFDLSFDYSSENHLKLLTAHLAVLEMLGSSLTESAMYCRRADNQSKMVEYKKYYKLCQQVLAIIVFDKLSLIQLLNMSENKMKLLVRNETFTSKIKGVCTEHKLSELYPYYYNTLVKRISKAEQMVELEEAAVLVICKMLKGTINQHYHFARRVVGNLGKFELEQLHRVYE